MNDATTAGKVRRREKFKKVLKRGLLSLGLVIAALIATNAAFISVRGKRIDAKIAAIRAAGDPVSILQLAPVPVPAEQNAALHLSQAREAIDGVSQELYKIYGELSFRRLNTDELQTVESTLAASPSIVPLIRLAADCAAYAPLKDYSIEADVFNTNTVARLGELRDVSRLLAAREQLLVARGDREEALQTCLALLRLSRLYDQEPLVVGYLVSQACRGIGIQAVNDLLRSGPLPQPSHASLEAELARHDNSAAYMHALKTERVLGIEIWSGMRMSWTLWPTRTALLSDESDYLDMIGEQLEIASRPSFEVTDANLESKHRNRIGSLSLSILPSLLECRKVRDRTTAEIRCLRILNAVHGRLDAGDDSEPKLDRLDLPPDATVDPFTGSPLRLKQTTAGWVVYSTGTDLQDDQGDFAALRDVGVGPIRTSKSAAD